MNIIETQKYLWKIKKFKKVVFRENGHIFMELLCTALVCYILTKSVHILQVCHALHIGDPKSLGDSAL